jgi:transglutaminase-like putative cysteine protease
MQYLVRHLTRFVYSSPIFESMTELRMQPLDRAGQRCLRFDVTTSQKAKVFAYRDHFDNAVHYFDIPGRHTRLDVSIESVVSVEPPPALPDRLPASAWRDLDAALDRLDLADWLGPSHFAHETPALAAFARAARVGRHEDPLTTLRMLNRTIYAQFAYEPQTTRVDSPIDDALRARAGVCQDFAHIMIALCHSIGVPARYVSGYIAPSDSAHDRSAVNATHAWVEAWLPECGWVGLDPTNDILADDRHIAVALGRDYADVPPTRGVFKGDAGSQLSVAVAVTPSMSPVKVRDLTPSVRWIVPARPLADATDAQRQQQQQ